MQDASGAFVARTSIVVPGAVSGPLHGLTFAAKDLFDVQGHVTGAGNPDWARTHTPARRSAWVVDRLIEAGATLVGKTVTDEISLGLLGINRFHGTPLNPRAPDRVPGGSSSGSASAVAGGLADFALGTDSGGSVRIPASFTGLYGLRPTHGAIPVDGMMTQSPSFDTAGFFAGDASTFEVIGDLLLPATEAGTSPSELLVASDAFATADPTVREALQSVLHLVMQAVPSVRETVLAPDGLETWCVNQRLLQALEFGQTFAEWIDRCNPTFSFEVASSLVRAAALNESDVTAARLLRASVRARLDEMLGSARVLCLPTSPILPILRTARLSEMRQAVDRIVHLTCIAGLTGLPQVSLPLAASGGIPVGLSLIGPRGGDRMLLAFARRLAASATTFTA